MIRTLDASMLNLPYSLEELSPLAAKYGMQAISADTRMMQDPVLAQEIDAVVKFHGLQWGLMPMPADFYHWDLEDTAFSEALEVLKRQAALAEKIGITHAYNHVWSSGPRAFDENFEWHVKRVHAVSQILHDHGVHYGLEFLGPHELRKWQTYEFVHSLAGVAAIADAAGGTAGIAFDTFHWYCSNNGCMDDLLWMSQHTERLVAVHMNDAVQGVPFDQQLDMQRRLPMETGIIDTRDILQRFMAKPNDALYMIEPFEPGRTRFHNMAAEEAVKAVADIFEKLEAGRS